MRQPEGRGLRLTVTSRGRSECTRNRCGQQTFNRGKRCLLHAPARFDLYDLIYLGIVQKVSQKVTLTKRPKGPQQWLLHELLAHFCYFRLLFLHEFLLLQERFLLSRAREIAQKAPLYSQSPNAAEWKAGMKYVFALQRTGSQSARG